MRLPTLMALLATAAVLSACSDARGSEAESLEPPSVGECRVLTLEDVSKGFDTVQPVDCQKTHTAETFVVSEFTGALADEEPDSRDLGAHVYRTCQKKFMSFIGGTDSLVLRSVLTWAWFRPSDAAWDKGARWFRCDVIGGGEQSAAMVELPESAKGTLLGQPEDRWMVCADGPSLADATKVPCSQQHTWRAVTTIVLGKADDPYPGDRVVEVRTRDFCSDSVGAWLNYPIDYDYAYTWFHKAEWEAGNRRSICWARTDQ